MSTVLELFKLDMGITHDLRDELFVNLFYACQQEIERKGIKLDLQQTDDMMLLVDFALWQYRKRGEDAPLSTNLKNRLQNRKLRGRANAD